MADYRRHYDEEPLRPGRDWSARADDEVRPWFGNEKAEGASTGAYRTDDRGYHDRYRAERARDDSESVPAWLSRERGGYWRTYEPQGTYSGRGPKGYQRADERVREEICDAMTDDAMLDASEITVAVTNGEVVLGGSVTSRLQKRRAEDVAERISGVKDVTNQLRVSREANGHNHTASPPVSQASGNGTPSKSTAGTTT